ncbi:uncharacterized protein LOC129004477 [Macrosteles quadrilineatus]|uniref:uncharacterized protein LOC129004477 n=1 Tax=Macrosteles quadrilineatus TaxID=74068 RepID=UPI0023E09E37|nr:uncharacterized protein LOC129004477 [Macrosteles quadrilineatus]
MEIMRKLSNLLDSMLDVHKKRTRLMINYVAIAKLNGALECLGDEVDSPRLREKKNLSRSLPPVLSRFLEDMQRDLALLRSLQGLLSCLRALDQNVVVDLLGIESSTNGRERDVDKHTRGI